MANDNIRGTGVNARNNQNRSYNNNRSNESTSAPQKRTGLLETTIDIDPVGVIYNLSTEKISSYVSKYLDIKNVDGIDEVVTRVISDGSSSPEVAIYVFISPNSTYINTGTDMSIPKIVRDRMSSPTKITHKFREILTPLCGADISVGKRAKNVIFVKLDIFRVLGLMLSADPSEHRIVIPSALRGGHNKNGVITAIKQKMPTKIAHNDGNKYTVIVDDLERRR